MPRPVTIFDRISDTVEANIGKLAGAATGAVLGGIPGAITGAEVGTNIQRKVEDEKQKRFLENNPDSRSASLDPTTLPGINNSAIAKQEILPKVDSKQTWSDCPCCRGQCA